MTRWARGGPKKRPHDASSWGQLQSAGGQSSIKRNESSKGLEHRHDDDELKPKKKKVTVKAAASATDRTSAACVTVIKKTVNSEKSQRKSDCTDRSGKHKKRIHDRPDDGASGDTFQVPKMKDIKSSKLSEGKKKTIELSASEVAAKKHDRREERRLKRIKERHGKKVCFQCRKPGHGVADCPDLIMDVEQGMGMCFRCGSTEHSSHQCRVKLKSNQGDFPFAKCFICQEMGHLAKQCPDNPRGLYPHGGACKLCGSVEHFARECPEEPKALATEPHFGMVSMATRRLESADAEPTLSRPHRQLMSVLNRLIQVEF